MKNGYFKKSLAILVVLVMTLTSMCSTFVTAADVVAGTEGSFYVNFLKTEYALGEPLEMEVYYNGSLIESVATHAGGYVVNGYDPYTIGEQNIEITYLSPDGKSYVYNAIVIVSENAAAEVYQIASGTLDNTGIIYELYSDGAMYIYGKGEMPDYSYFPVEGEVTAPWYEQRAEIKSVIFEYGITRIGGGTFATCDNLTSVTIPDSVNVIGDKAFFECPNLTSVDIPESVTVIESNAFASCSNLNDINIPKNVTSIGNGAVEYTAITNAVIPEGVTYINQWTFSGCENLTSVTIPAGVSTIDLFAFYKCSNLTDVYYLGSREDWKTINIKDHNEDLKNANIHYGATGDTTIPDDEVISTIELSEYYLDINVGEVWQIKANVYPYDYAETVVAHELSNPDVVEVNNYITEAGDIVFEIRAINAGSTVLRVYTPDSKEYAECTINVMGDSASGGSIGDSLKWELFEDGTLNIRGEGEITETPWQRYSDQINYVRIEYGVTYIPEYAFAKCMNLTSVYMAETVTYIGNCAFDSCLNLEYVEIPESVNYIGSYAFAHSNSVMKVTFGGSRAQWNSLITETVFDGVEYYVECLKTDEPTDSYVELSDYNLNLRVGAVHEITATFYPYELIDTVTCESTNEGVVNVDGKLSADGVMHFTVYAMNEGYTCLRILTSDGYVLAECNVNVKGNSSGGSSGGGGGDADRYVDSLEVVNYQYEYCVGEELNISVIAHYSDGTTEEISRYYEDGSIGYEVIGFDNSEAAAGTTQTVQVIYQGMSEEFDVEIIGRVEPPTDGAYLDGGSCGDNLGWTLYDDGRLVIHGEGDMTAYDSVTANPWYNYKESITSVEFEYGVTNIARLAFYKYTNLSNVKMAETIRHIESRAFYGCENIKNIILPKNLTYISNYAFANCYNLASFTIPERVVNIGNNAFDNCYNFTSVSIPKSVKTIGSSAFAHCSALTEVYYGGTEEEWTKLLENTTIFDGVGNLKMYYNVTVVPEDTYLDNIHAVLNRDVYYVGDSLDITVYANYSDGTGYEITDYNIENYDSSIAGEQEVVITYYYDGMYYSCSFFIYLHDVPVTPAPEPTTEPTAEPTVEPTAEPTEVPKDNWYNVSGYVYDSISRAPVYLRAINANDKFENIEIYPNSEFYITLPEGIYDFEFYRNGTCLFTYTDVNVSGEYEWLYMPSVDVSPALVGDLDNNGMVKIDDLSSLIIDYDRYTYEAANPAADIDGNGEIKLPDLQVLLDNYNLTTDTNKETIVQLGSLTNEPIAYPYPTGEPYSEARIDVSLEDASDVGEGVQKLVFKAENYAKVNSFGLVFSYDNTVVQPVYLSRNTLTDLTLDETTSNSTARKVFKAYADEDYGYEFSFAPINIITSGNRTSVKVDTYSLDAIDISNGVVFNEFYFRVADGAELNNDTFKLETNYYSEGSFLCQHYSDPETAAAVYVGKNKFGTAYGNDTAYLASFPNFTTAVPTEPPVEPTEAPVAEIYRIKAESATCYVGETPHINVYAYYTDGTVREVSDYIMYGFDPNRAGTQKVEIEYDGCGTTTTITVIDAPVEVTPAPSDAPTLESTLARVDVSVEDASDVADGVKKLVFRATTPLGDAGVNTFALLFSYDNTVIQPVDADYGNDIPIESENPRNPKYAFKAYEDEKTAFSFAPLKIWIKGNRTGVAVDTYTTEGAIDATNGVTFTEFYFRVKDGAWLNDDTFKLETEYSDGSFLAMQYLDPNTAAAVNISGNYKYGWAKEGAVDTAYIGSFSIFDTTEPTPAPSEPPIDYPTEEPTPEPTEPPATDAPPTDAPTEAPVELMYIMADNATCYVGETPHINVWAYYSDGYTYQLSPMTTTANGYELLHFDPWAVGTQEVLIKYRENGKVCQAYAYIDVEHLATDAPPTDEMADIYINEITTLGGLTERIPVYISNNYGFAGFTFKIYYDSSKLIPVSIEAGEGMPYSLFSNLQDPSFNAENADYITAVASYDSNITTENGVLFYINFEVKDNTSGKAYIDLELEEFRDKNGNNIRYNSLTGGVVNIIRPVYGDVNADGDINIADLILMQQYLAGWSGNYNSFFMTLADTYYDGIINTKDIVLLSRYHAGWNNIVLGPKAEEVPDDVPVATPAA